MHAVSLFSFELAEPIVTNETVTAFTNSSAGSSNSGTNRKPLFQLQEKLFNHLNASILNLTSIHANIFDSNLMYFCYISFLCSLNIYKYVCICLY